MRIHKWRVAALLFSVSIGSQVLSAKAKHPKPDDRVQDQIVVVAHIPNADGPITRFIATRHYDRTYVYAEREAGQAATLIDLTNQAKPEILSGANAGGPLLVVETPAPSSQTIRLMDFSDPAKPKVTRRFDGVTAVEKLTGGLILLANPDGIWILSQRFAEDPEVQKRYARKVIYGEN